MSIINKANCASPDSVFNTGKPGCDLAKGKMKGVIFVDRGVVFTAAECASIVTFIAALKEKTIAPRGQRAYPVFDLLNFEDNTGDPSTGGIGNLSTATIITSDAIPAFRFGYNGSEARMTRMSLMAGASLDVLFVDQNFAVYGTASGSDLKGFAVLQAYHDTSKFIVGDSVNQYSFRVTLGDITEYRDLSKYVVTNQGILTARGLVNAELRFLSRASNVWTYDLIADGGTDLPPLFAALGTLDADYSATADGAALTITGVAIVGGKLAVTYDNTAYGALASGAVIQLNGPTAEELSDAGIAPYEIVPDATAKP